MYRYNNWLITGNPNFGKTNLIISELEDLIREGKSDFIITENDGVIKNSLANPLKYNDYKVISIVPDSVDNKLEMHELLNKKGLSSKDLNKNYAVFIENNPDEESPMTEKIIKYFSKISDYNEEVDNIKDMYIVLDQADRLCITNVLKTMKGYKFHNRKHFILAILNISQLFDMGLNDASKLSVFDKQTHLTPMGMGMMMVE